MKKTFTFLFACVCAQLMVAQDCADLFISEYLEGSGNNKGFELYNPTNAPIDLGPYVLQRYSNGDNSPTDEINLQGTIEAYGTWVVVNGQTEDVELGGGTISPAVDPGMQELADQLDNPYPAPTYMNGNDALVLVKNGNAILDIFGKPGEDPGICWTDDADAGYITTESSTFITANHTMVRKPDVLKGVTTIPVVFNGLAEYDTLAINTWTNLGTHGCLCDPNFVSVEEEAERITYTLFPNPTTDVVSIEVSEAISKIEVYDLLGKQVILETFNAAVVGIKELDLSDLEQGQYMVNVYLANGTTFSQTVLKR